MPTETPAPTHRVGLAVLALACGGFAIGTTEFATMGLLPDIASDLRVSIPSAGWLISAYALGVVVGAPLLAVAAARVPRKALILLLMAFFAVGNVGSALAPGFLPLLLARFVSGLPHGAFFGVGAVVLASMVASNKRGQVVSMMLMGLSVANIAGVPLATFIGQHASWRSAFGLVSLVGLLTIVLVALWVPRELAVPPSDVRSELSALRRPQVLLALLIGTVGFGGMFAAYSYIAPTMTEVAGASAGTVPVVLSLFGVGGTLGMVIGGKLADRAVMPSIFGFLTAIAMVLAVFTVSMHRVVPAAITVLFLGLVGSALVPSLQTRLMDVSPDAQSLAASLNHSALNLANASGAWLGGLVIAAGLGYGAASWVGVGLAVAGLGVAAVSALLGRRTRAGAPRQDGPAPAGPQPHADLSAEPASLIRPR